jgi:Tol biopolymer transport system component
MADRRSLSGPNGLADGLRCNPKGESMKLKYLVAAVGLLASVSVLLPSAGAVFPGRNGRITFMRTDHAGLWQIWVGSAHLRNQTKLTDQPANSGWPVWAPGGRRIAFDSDRADRNPNDENVINDIFTMRPDGNGVRNLTHSRGFSADANYSPSGKRIVFEADRGDYPDKMGIYVMRKDGTHVRRITNTPDRAKQDVFPRFSPNGKWLVFTRLLGFADEAPAALFKVRGDGTHLQRLTSFSMRAGDADWSPDGKRLVFEGNPRLQFGEIYVMDADGRHRKNITRNNGHGGARDPVWSPNGKKILFGQGQVVHHVFKDGLATMRPDGSKRAFLSKNPKEEHHEDWESIP